MASYMAHQRRGAWCVFLIAVVALRQGLAHLSVSYFDLSMLMASFTAN